ncbi:MAG: hypothetical protein ACXACR_16315 [Candidatus Hodarchaeales archaeon]|jgi:heme A synthase
MKQKNTSNEIKWLRIAYWAGAIGDFIIGIVMLFPGLTQLIWGLDIPFNTSGIFITKYFAVVAFLWTALLLWADRKPLERRGVAVLTFFIVFGLMVVEIWGITQNIVPMLNMGILLGTQVILLILFGFSYYNAREIE